MGIVGYLKLELNHPSLIQSSNGFIIQAYKKCSLDKAALLNFFRKGKQAINPQGFSFYVTALLHIFIQQASKWQTTNIKSYN